MLVAVAMNRFLNSEARAGLGAAFVLLSIVAAVEIADGSAANYLGLTATAPFLAAAFSSWREVVAIGVVAMTFDVLFGAIDLSRPGVENGRALEVTLNLIGVLIATAIAAAVGVIRQRQTVRFAELSRLASVAQGAVLRPHRSTTWPPGHRRSIHFRQRRSRHRRRPVRGSGHSLRRTNDHRRRPGKGTRRRPPRQHRSWFISARRL